MTYIINLIVLAISLRLHCCIYKNEVVLKVCYTHTFIDFIYNASTGAVGFVTMKRHTTVLREQRSELDVCTMPTVCAVKHQAAEARYLRSRLFTTAVVAVYHPRLLGWYTATTTIG